jgi:hypothetical protein
MPRKAFTVDEANAMIPSLVDVFRGIEVEKRAIRELANKIDVLELLWGGALRDESHPDHDEFAAYREGIDRSLLAIQQAVEERIVGRGMRFPTGGIEAGLVDFPTTYSGRWVFLCWKLGERELTHWHEIDAGFQGRKKITDAQRRSMGTGDPGSIDDSGLDV